MLEHKIYYVALLESMNEDFTSFLHSLEFITVLVINQDAPKS